MLFLGVVLILTDPHIVDSPYVLAVGVILTDPRMRWEFVSGSVDCEA